jgi:hypothetical protein
MIAWSDSQAAPLTGITSQHGVLDPRSAPRRDWGEVPVYQERQPNVQDNPARRIPQREVYAALARVATVPADSEIGVVLPVGCGKSGRGEKSPPLSVQRSASAEAGGHAAQAPSRPTLAARLP